MLSLMAEFRATHDERTSLRTRRRWRCGRSGRELECFLRRKLRLKTAARVADSSPALSIRRAYRYNERRPASNRPNVPLQGGCISS